MKGGQTSLIWSDRRLKNFCWTPGGRIIGTLSEPDGLASSSPSHANLWEIDVRKGQSPSPPNRLTNLAGFTPLSLSMTADGKRLALIRSYDQSDVYVGELETNASRLRESRRLTLDDRIDWPGGWTRDSKAVLFYSDRQGTLDIFKQQVESRTAELLVVDPEEKRQPQLSPDGLWILYLAWPRMNSGSLPAGKMMRIPAGGGPPQAMFGVRGYPGSAQTPREFGTRVLTTSGYPDFRCPSLPGTSCVLSESDSNKVVFYSFDPMHESKRELVSVEAEGPSFWDISPDGSKIAWGEMGRNNRIRILGKTADESRDVPITGFRVIASVGWSADGTSLFLSGTAPEGGAILRHVFVDGRSQLLYQADAWLERPMPSPDGRYLAFGEATSTNNVWTITNFERK